MSVSEELCPLRAGTRLALVKGAIESVSPPSTLLQDDRALVDRALRLAVGELAEPVRAVVRYHFGWTTPDGRPAAGSGGKMMRASFVLRCAEAVAGTVDPGLPGAVAVELVHNSSLLQDDVMDGDQLRRHRPTAWTVFGESAALLAGDALVALAFDQLMRDGSTRAVAGVRLLASSYQQLVIGQALDLDYESRPRVTVDDYYRMADGKTASLLRCATKLGAILAGADAEMASAFGAFGAHLGLAFQLVDDILGIWGDSVTTGKPVGADICARKKSVPVVYALSLKEAGGLVDLYDRAEPLTHEDVARVTHALEDLGARTWAEARAHEHLNVAIGILDRAGLDAQRQKPLLDLARLVTARGH